MESLKLFAKAKINLSLDVIRKRQDGYHDLKMIMQTIDLKDEIFISKIDNDNIEVSCSNVLLPQGEANIAWKAANLFREKYNIVEGIKIHIIKNIPSAAGLAGGSTDAAAVLRGMTELFNIKTSDSELAKIGLKVGADVPYCIYGGTKLAEGVGEILSTLHDFEGIDLVLIKPKFDVSTPWVFKNYSIGYDGKRPNTEKLIDSISSGDVKSVAKNMINVLESVTVKAYPEIEEIKRKLLENGALGAMMSGSGPTVFGIFQNQRKAIVAINKFESDIYECILTKTCGR